MWKMVNVIINVSVKSFGKIVYLIQYVLTRMQKTLKGSQLKIEIRKDNSGEDMV